MDLHLPSGDRWLVHVTGSESRDSLPQHHMERLISGGKSDSDQLLLSKLSGPATTDHRCSQNRERARFWHGGNRAADGWAGHSAESERVSASGRGCPPSKKAKCHVCAAYCPTGKADL